MTTASLDYLSDCLDFPLDEIFHGVERVLQGVQQGFLLEALDVSNDTPQRLELGGQGAEPCEPALPVFAAARSKRQVRGRPVVVPRSDLIYFQVHSY